MPRMQVLGDGFHRRHDVRHVGVLGLAQRRRHADVDRVELGDRAVVAGGAQPPGADEVVDVGRRHVGDVGLAGCDRRDLPRVEVEADGLEAASRKFDGERQTDIAKSDDTDAGGSCSDATTQFLGNW